MAPEYFKRELTPGEAQCFVDGVMRGRRAGWEQARFIAFAVLSPYSENLQLHDVATFDWEREEEEETDDVEQARIIGEMRARIPEMEKKLKEKKEKNSIKNGL